MSNNSRLLSRDEYYSHLRAGEFGTCAFCDEEDKQIVLNTGEYWLWIASIAPYWRYHTMFVPKRHITDIDELTQDEYSELLVMKKAALQQFYDSGVKWSDGTTINTFTYMWRVREDGVDLNFKVIKTSHLHLHMWPELDGFQAFQVDPNATDWDPATLKKS